MKLPVLLSLTLLMTAVAGADDQLRRVQTELKNQGFYYGEVTGEASAETTAALRRYQIRHGLEVTGAANKQTLGALGVGGARPAAPAAPPPPEPATKPPIHLRKDQPDPEGDRAFLEREQAQRSARAAASSLPPEPLRDRSVVLPPAPLVAPGDDFPVLFAQTPYATAPLEVQQRTLRNAQATLASRGFYRDIIDGLPGRATEEALLSYQRAARLTLTGRLDLATLSALRLLPSRTVPRRSAPEPTQRVYRGIWVN
jgi:peptidoglycan hydrolase-like protein with peptidoglycan-binding domain